MNLKNEEPEGNVISKEDGIARAHLPNEFVDDATIPSYFLVLYFSIIIYLSQGYHCDYLLKSHKFSLALIFAGINFRWH